MLRSATILFLSYTIKYIERCHPNEMFLGKCKPYRRFSPYILRSLTIVLPCEEHHKNNYFLRKETCCALCTKHATISCWFNKYLFRWKWRPTCEHMKVIVAVKCKPWSTGKGVFINPVQIFSILTPTPFFPLLHTRILGRILAFRQPNFQKIFLDFHEIFSKAVLKFKKIVKNFLILKVHLFQKRLAFS